MYRVWEPGKGGLGGAGVEADRENLLFPKGYLCIILIDSKKKYI